MSQAETQPSEAEMRAAYEAELNRITSTEMILQTVVSLVNIGGRRLGLAGGPDAPRDLEQAEDAIDGARALMPVLERRMARELGPLRDAIAQLQMAYAREARSKGGEPQGAPGGDGLSPESQSQQAPSAPEGPGGGTAQPQSRPGPAESSGRLWVPGR